VNRVSDSPPQPDQREDERVARLVELAQRYSRSVNEVVVSVAAIVLALLVGAVVIGVSKGKTSEGLTAYQALWNGAFGSWSDVGATLVQAAPFALAGLGIAFAFRGGLFNIGAEGQVYAGAIAATVVGVGLAAPGWVVLPVAIVAGAAAGALWALIPGLLKAYRGAHEVITTMMMNYVALNLLTFAVDNNTSNGALGPLQDAKFAQPQSGFVSVNFPVFGGLNSVVILALACAVIFSLVMARTTFGYKVRAIGFNLKAARYGGIKVDRTVVAVLVISGAFAGVAGMSEIFSYTGYLIPNLDGFSLGFNAIAVALLGRTTAVGAILAAILFGAFNQGATSMEFAGIDVNVVGMIEGLIVFFIGADALVRYMGNRGAGMTRLGRAEPEPGVPAETAAI